VYKRNCTFLRRMNPFWADRNPSFELRKLYEIIPVGENGLT